MSYKPNGEANEVFKYAKTRAKYLVSEFMKFNPEAELDSSILSYENVVEIVCTSNPTDSRWGDCITPAISLYPHLRDFGGLEHHGRTPDRQLNDLLSDVDLLLKRYKKDGNKSNGSRSRDKYVRRLARLSMRNLLLVANRTIDPVGLFLTTNARTQVDEIVDFLVENLPLTFDAMPDVSLKNGGIAKLLRGFFGILKYAYYFRLSNGDKELNNEYLSNAIKLAYAYGITYALVDNLIDSSFFENVEDKEYFIELVSCACRGVNPSGRAPKSPYAKELGRVLETVEPLLKQSKIVREYLEAFHLAQSEDNALDSEYLNTLPATEAVSSLLCSAMLKAGLTRACGIVIANYDREDEIAFIDDIDNLLISGLCNQLSNDFEDFIDDSKYEQVTLFTYLDHDGTAYHSPLNIFWRAMLFASERIAENEKRNKEDILRAYLVRYVECIRELSVRHTPAKASTIIRKFLGTSDFDRRLTESNNRILRVDVLPEVHTENSLISVLNDVSHEVRRHLTRVSDKGTLMIKRLSERHGCRLERTINTLELSDCSRHILQSECSRLRPIFCFSIGESLGIAPGHLISLGVAVELFHSASLLIDDLPAQDNSSLRRGKTAAHLVFGEAEVHLAVVELISLAYSLLSSIDVQVQARQSLVSIAARHIAGRNGLCAGQRLDLLARGHGALSIEAILEVSRQKTGAAFVFCLESMNHLSSSVGADDEVMAEIGYSLGIIYQLRDDLIDGDGAKCCGGEEELRYKLEETRQHTERVIATSVSNLECQNVLVNFLNLFVTDIPGFEKSKHGEGARI